ncbi:IreB family regulatory phosphoprotein [Sedimentibacter sp. zth1]|uniref:IreB family regulatory phosphoprotein n=1 Tax=Sedimentibacter sp. zth1 TaxID=2816908 RepID=UPI001A91377A|nr:IreB family regulatory phosphoprotein [Sedimentibacter sp. zth1]QSX06434.1 IreB family regulatory phosphoprotein [Sedimentibacter sp. zth1]
MANNIEKNLCNTTSNIGQNTAKFDYNTESLNKAREILSQVYQSLQEKGYNPSTQLIGYLLSGDPTYITNYNNARSLIRKIERDELLEEILKVYLDVLNL